LGLLEGNFDLTGFSQLTKTERLGAEGRVKEEAE